MMGKLLAQAIVQSATPRVAKLHVVQEVEEHFIITDIPKGHLFHEKGRRVYGSLILAQTLNRLLASGPSLDLAFIHWLRDMLRNCFLNSPR
jgi:hypothetical protein